MGASASVSTIDIVNKAITDISNEVTSELKFDINQSINNVLTADGNINISGTENFNYSDTQLKQIFSKLNEKNFNDKVNQEIQQLCESLIKGLNIGNISVSTSVLRNIIENAIKIKDSTISSCLSKQQYEINNIITSKKDINISNTKNYNIAKNVINCITESTSNTDILRQTDTMIKQVTKSTTEGLDLNTLIIGLVAVSGVIGITGLTAVTTLIGPIMMLAGGYFAYREYDKQNENIFENQLLYLKNDIQSYDNNLIYVKQSNKTDTDNLISTYGKANIYEFFQNKVKLYNWKSLDKKDLNVKNDIDENDLNFDKIANNSITMNVKNSNKYSKTFTLKNFIKNIKIVKNLPDNNVYEENDVKILINNFKYLHSVTISQYIQNKEEILEIFDFEPVILSINKEKRDNIMSNPIFLGSVSVSAIGLILTLKNTQLFKNGKS